MEAEALRRAAMAHRVLVTNVAERYSLEREEAVGRDVIADEAFSIAAGALTYAIRERCGPSFLRPTVGETAMADFRKSQQLRSGQQSAAAMGWGTVGGAHSTSSSKPNASFLPAMTAAQLFGGGGGGGGGASPRTTVAAADGRRIATHGPSRRAEEGVSPTASAAAADGEIEVASSGTPAPPATSIFSSAIAAGASAENWSRGNFVPTGLGIEGGALTTSSSPTPSRPTTSNSGGGSAVAAMRRHSHSFSSSAAVAATALFAASQQQIGTATPTHVPLTACSLSPRRPISAARVAASAGSLVPSSPRVGSAAAVGGGGVGGIGLPLSPRTGRPTSSSLGFPRAPHMSANMHAHRSATSNAAAAAITAGASEEEASSSEVAAEACRSSPALIDSVPRPPQPPTSPHRGGAAATSVSGRRHNHPHNSHHSTVSSTAASAAAASLPPASAFSIHSVFASTPTTSQTERAARLRDQQLRLVAERDAERHGRDACLFEAEAALEAAHYSAVFKAERIRVAAEAAARDAAVLARRSEAGSMRGARAFVAGEERRARDAIIAEYEGPSSVAFLWSEKVRLMDEGRMAEHAAFLNTFEQRELVAQRERAAKASQQAEERRRQAFLRDQRRMVEDCKHSRTHQSVFVGALAKRMCLMCKVKFDEKLGIYVRMR